MGDYKEWKDLEIFQIIEELAEKIWDKVIEWDNFAKFSVGLQLVKAIDSFGANIEEADGRYHFKEKINFLYIARESLKETRRWITKSNRRKLFGEEIGKKLLKEKETKGLI
jgi:four helix bundle protein